MFLSQLPIELFLYIADALHYECDINSLVRTTRRLYDLLNPYLYRYDADHGDTWALHWAMRTGNVVTARKALMEKAGLDVEIHEDWAPVIVSWAFGNDLALGYLQREFATVPDKKCDDIWTLASSHCRGSLLQCLLKQGGPDDRIYHREVNEECLAVVMQRAAKWGNLEVVQLFAKKFPETVNARNGGHLPLVEALQSGHAEIIRFLLSVGADPNDDDDSLLTLARDLETLQLLLENGNRPDPVTHGNRGEYSLEILRDMVREKGTAMTELLLKHINVEEKMSSINQVDREILLEAAAEAGLIDIVRQILERGIHGDTRPWGPRTFQQDRPGVNTPLNLAIKNGQEKVVALLLEYGGYPYRVGRRRPSPIQMAANQGSKEMVELLLNRDLDLSRRSYPIASYASPPLPLGICALYDAMEFPPVFQLLLDQGALY